MRCRVSEDVSTSSIERRGRTREVQVGRGMGEAKGRERGGGGGEEIRVSGRIEQNQGGTRDAVDP